MNITLQRTCVDPRKFVYSAQTIALARLLQIAATGQRVRAPSAIYLAQAHGIHTNPKLVERLLGYV